MKTQKIITLFMFMVMLTSISGISSGCTMAGAVHGDGKVVKQTRVVSSFDGIEISGAFDVYLKQGSIEEVIIEADENLQSIITAEVKGSTLMIDNKKPINHPTTLKVYITFKDLKKIETSGAVDIVAENKITVNELGLSSSGASDVRMDISAKKLDLNTSGASKLRLSGSVTDVSADLSGAGDLYGFDLVCENFKIEISGAGKAQINVTKSIDAEISGAGSIHYKGNPTKVNQSVSGSGSIKRDE
ncbi:MAG: head GIN domain-containing protein [Bacteroidota bacterium]